MPAAFRCCSAVRVLDVTNCASPVTAERSYSYTNAEHPPPPTQLTGIASITSSQGLLVPSRRKLLQLSRGGEERICDTGLLDTQIRNTRYRPLGAPLKKSLTASKNEPTLLEETSRVQRVPPIVDFPLS